MPLFSDKLNVSEESIRDAIETIMFIVIQSSKLSVSLSTNFNSPTLNCYTNQVLIKNNYRLNLWLILYFIFKFFRNDLIYFDLFYS
jgi:hypothetical protein